jgi:hypothetical protein
LAYFEDLTPYSYFRVDKGEPVPVNIGWLDPDRPFPQGPTTEEFRTKLRQLCEQPVQQTRGLHRCEFCLGPVGSAEMRVEGKGRVYAAPVLVHHYVVAHDYRPPDEFIEAVLAWSGSRWGASKRLSLLGRQAP